MDVQPTKGRPGRCLPRSVAVVLHRVSTEGFQLPHLCRENEQHLSRRENTLSHGSACSGESAAGKKSVRCHRRVRSAAGKKLVICHRRVRSPPSRLIAELTKPLSSNYVTSHELRRVTVNGCRVKQSVVSSKPTAQQEDGRKQTATNVQCTHDDSEPSHSTPIPARNESTNTLATGSASVGNSLPQSQPNSKYISLCISPSLPTEQSRGPQQSASGNKIEKGPKTKTVASDRHWKRRKKMTKKRRRVVSVEFLDSSDTSDTECEAKECPEAVRKRGRTSDDGQEAKLTARKRRKFSSSGEEEDPLTVTQPTVPPYKPVAVDLAPPTVPTLGSEVAVGGEEMCTSDDDFAVSMRLEELQQRQRMKEAALMDRSSRGDEEMQLTCVPPNNLCPSSAVENTERDGAQCNVQSPIDAATGGSCTHYGNLEIDPRAVISCGECGVVNMPRVLVVQEENNSSARISTVHYSILRSVGTGNTWGSRRLLFGARRGCKPPTTLSTRCPVEAKEKDEELPEPAEGERDRERTESSTVARRVRGRPKSRESDTDKGKTKSVEGEKRGRGRPKSTEGEKRGRGRPKLTEGPKRGRGRPKSTEGAKRSRGRPKSTEGPKRGRGRPKSAENAKRGRGRPKLTEKGQGQPKSTEGAERGRGRPKSIEKGQSKSMEKSRERPPEGTRKHRTRANSTEGVGKSKGCPKSTEAGSRRGRPKSIDSGKVRAKLKSVDGKTKNTSLSSGRKPVKEKRGRPRKENGQGTSNRDTPASGPTQGSSTSPLPPLTSPEDSGYPGSICSSSSQGQKAPLKSPEDVGTTRRRGDSASAPAGSVPLLGEHRRGTVNTAELGMFSPELTGFATPITNLPMPLDPPPWEWSAMGMGGANSGELYQVNCTIEEESEATQNLFEPSKMIIAKVESLNEDSRFNEYLNEILESEEVMECLNSINTEPLTAPVQLQSATHEQPTLVPQSDSTPATSAPPDNGQTEACVAPQSTVPATTSPTTVSVSKSSTPLATACDSGLVQPPVAETVAAYVAAETSLAPVSLTDSLTASLNVSSGHSTDANSTHSSTAQAGPRLTTSLPPPLSLAPNNCAELRTAGNVMWSPSGMETDVSFGAQVCKPPSPLQQQSQTAPPEPKSRDCILKELLKQPATTVPATTATPSTSTPAKPRPEKRRIIRVKKRLKKTPAAAVEAGSTDRTKAETVTADKGKSCTKNDIAPSGTGNEAQKAEVKSRNGRLIKPSWKLSQNTQAPKCVASPSTALHKPPTASLVSEHTAQFEANNTAVRRSTNSLSMAAVVGSSMKRLPDIPATPCSPNPTVSLPSASATLSMSLDDILRQMNDDEPQEEKIKFAESLLADLPTPDDAREERGGREKGEHSAAEGASGDVEKREGPTKMQCERIVTQISDVQTQSALGAKKTNNATDTSTSAFSLSLQQQAPGELVTGNIFPVFETRPSSQLSAENGPEPSSSGYTRASSDPPSPYSDTEDCSPVDMSLCSSDTTKEQPLTSLTFKRELSANTRRVSQDTENEGEEDEIEIFADDIDTFTVYTMDEKKKKSTPPPMPSPPRDTSPQPCQVKAESLWGEGQRSIQTELSSRNFTHPRMGRLQRDAHFSSVTIPAFPLIHLPSITNLPAHPPSAPPSLSSLPHFPLSDHTPPPPLNTPSGSSGHHRLSSTSTLSHGARSGPSKPCRNFLRGCCNYKRCKFSHAPLDSFPDDQLESTLQCLSLEVIPPEIAWRYVVKIHPHLNSWFPLLLQFIRGLLNKHWDTVFEAYKKLSVEGVQLKASLLSRFLELCREQMQPLLNAFVQLPEIAHELMQKIRATQGSCSVENYRAMLRILDGAKKPVELMDVYQSMKADGHPASLDLLHLVIRGSLYTDERILQLLLDSKTCLSATNDIARIANNILERVSSQLLARNREIVTAWVSEVNGVLDIIGHDALLKLFNLFVSSQSWSSLLVLLEQSPRTTTGLGVRLCQPLSTMVVQQPSLSDRAMAILETMTDDALNEFSTEGWNAILMHSPMPGTSHRVSKLCRAISCSNKCLEQEALSALLEMVVANRQPSTGMTVLLAHLQFMPPVVPSMAVLSSFGELLLQTTLYQDLYCLVDKLIYCRVAPSLPILQSFVDSCSKEKAYSRLATVVRRAKDCGLHLEKTFYQRALVLLRPWGQDQVAISIIYKSLRTIDTETAPIPLTTNSTVFGSVSHVSAMPPLLREAHCDSGRSTPGSQVSRTSSSRPCSSKSHKSRRSLEGIFEKSNELPSIKPGIIALLESNGKQGQYGAMVSILHNLQDSSRPDYSSEVVQAMWRAITESEQKPANAFSCLLEQLKLAQPSSVNGSLIPCDHWLAAQLGIALLKMYADSEHWQSGFIILHHLHQYNISYIGPDHKPFAPLSPLKAPLPTPFALARIAVTTGLRVDNVEFAVSVLERCEWVRSCGPGEKQERIQLLVTVAEKCLESTLHNECCRCLQELDGLSMTSRHFAPVAKLYNRLFTDVMSTDSVDMDLCMSIYENMNSGNFPCLPENFSLLLGKLCDLLQFSTAGDLCKQAMDQDFYPPVTYGDMFTVHLPPSLHHIEASSLLEGHLHKMEQELEELVLHPLTIIFDEGTKHHLERALAETMTPSLPPVYTVSGDSSSGGGSAVISPAHLLKWFNTHFPNSHFRVEREKGRLLAAASSGADSTANRDGKTVVEPPKPTVASGLSTLDASATDSDSSAQTQTKPSQNVGQLKQQRRQFRESLCRSIVSELKPFYQGEKFNSYEDYLHLVKVLTTHVCKLTKPRPGTGVKWSVTDATRSQVRELVHRVMSHCTKYTPDSDTELGLTD